MRVYGIRPLTAIVVIGAMSLPVAGTSPVAAARRSAPKIGAQTAELRASDAASGDCFGSSVAVSSGTVVTGAPCSLTGNGKVYVFSSTKAGWKQGSELGSANPDRGLFAKDHFGSSVAASGTTLVAGAWGYADLTNQRFGGVVDLFTRAKTGWIKSAVLTVSNTADDEFGYSVAVSGNTVVVGDPTYGGGAGTAYVFTRTVGGWKETAQLKGKDIAATGSGYWPEFGESVSVSGNTVFVGSLGPPPKEDWAGAVYVFSKTTSGWTQTAELKGSDTRSGDAFGRSIALSGTTALIGAPYHPNLSTQPNAGRAYVFSYTSRGWKQIAELKASDAAGNGQFGISTALSGTLAIVGANNASASGRAYVFSHGAAGWKQVAELKGSDTASHDQFGFSVGIAGSTVIVGAPDHASISGRAYVFHV